jgi:anaerobic magnesium-protoporphyrin IX monomethyl ester cyclase
MKLVNLENRRIVLVNAPPLGILEPWYDVPDFPRGALANLAAYLRANGINNILCIDAKLSQLNFDQTINKILEFRPTHVGFTAFTNEIKPCAYIAAKVKQIDPSILTIVGGAHVSAIPEATLREFLGFDVVVVGDGEETLLEIITGAEFSVIKGVTYRSYGVIKRNPERDRILDQDNLPMPAWDMLPVGRHYWLQTAKGCPFKCVFCMNHNGRVVRKNSVEKAMDEIQFVIDNYHPEWIRFGDELFTADRGRTISFLEQWIERGFHQKVKWDLQTHVKYVDREMLRLFKKANITQLDMGVESGDSVILKSMGKATNEEMILRAFKMAHEEGIKTGSLLLLGQPNETIKSMQNTIRLAVKINSSIPMIGIMMPLPGTEVAKLAAKKQGGYSRISFDWDEYSKNVGVAVEFTNFSRKQIERVQFWGFVKVFVINFRILELIQFVWKYRVEGWGNFKKMIWGASQKENLFTQKPLDYDSILQEGEKPTAEDMYESKEVFDAIQQNEMRRTNKLRPDLIKEQMPVKLEKIDSYV